MANENDVDMGSLLSRHGNTFELTPSDKKLIKTSWAPVKKDMGKNGVTLFITFFKNYPQHMHYFSFQETSLSKLEVDPMLKLHGLRVLKEIDAIVESIDNPETLLHALRQNALNHRKRRIDKMAYDDLRRTILATFANLVGGKIFTPEVAIAWDKALSALFHVITDINDEHSE